MKLTAYPFDPTTGTLLPVYRDAYLRGDLSLENANAVDNYLNANAAPADATFVRLHQMRHEGEAIRPVGWMERQLGLIRTEPQRFRRRAAALVAGAVLVAGASFAAPNLPTATETPAASVAANTGDATEASAKMVTVHGRILDENGRPLVGATVLSKRTGRGAGTDANGNYTLRLPAAEAAHALQFAYAGYAEEQVQLNGTYTHNTTLVPATDGPAPAKGWLARLFAKARS